ncbi:hypothetical protein V8D89_015967, partial [Ganoderma adspersum]
APSNPSGVSGMCREFIWATSNWRNSGPRYDCVFVNHDSTQQDLLSLDIAQIKLFFTLCIWGHQYQCTLV